MKTLILNKCDVVDLFPFFIEINHNGTVTDVGPSLLKLGHILPGQHIDDTVSVERQDSPSLLDAPLKRLVLLTINGINAKFRGQLLLLAEHIYFLGTPWITSLESMRDMSLMFSDFARHDPISDFLILLRTSATSLNDAKQLAQKLKNSKDMAENANTTKTNFLAAMSHEIRTPLNIIMGMGDLLMETNVTEEQRSYLRTMSSSSELLLALISDVLDVSRIESQQINLESIPFDLNEIIEDVLEGMASRAFEKNLDIALQYDIGGPRHFKGDPSRIKQIVINLVGNAIKFTKTGHVFIVVSHNKTPMSQTVVINVTDTGIGISREKQAVVFERFVQASSSTNRNFGGTGLGLNITKSLVELMGGTILLESAPLKGSTFSVKIPLEPIPLKLPNPFGEDVPNINVCVASEKTRTSLSQTLKTWGAAVQITSAPNKGANYLFVDLGKTNRRIESSYKPEQIVYLAPFGYSLEHSKNRRQILTRPLRLDALISIFSKNQNRSRQQRPTRPATIAAKSTAAVLIVDDNHANALLIEAILKRNGYQSTTATNGLDAIREFKNKTFDVVLMDVEMPVMDGIECTQLIREWEKLNAKETTPVLAVTAHALKEYKDKCLNAGMNDFLTKPIGPRLLKDTINSWINRCPTVLIVDDFIDSRTLTDRMLRGSHRYRVMSAGTAAEATKMAETNKIDAAILDVDLPDAKGWSLADTLNSMPGLSQLPILFVTGHDDSKTRSLCLNRKRRDLLVKPIKKQMLVQRINTLLGLVPNTTPPRSKELTPSKTKSNATVWLPLPDDEDVRQLLPGYLENRKKELPLLKKHSAEANLKELARLGHNLKGSGSAYGLPKLSELGAILEKHARNEDLTKSTEACNHIKAYVLSLRLRTPA